MEFVLIIDLVDKLGGYMSLEEYHKKRDFEITTEPNGEDSSIVDKKSRIFVIQEHHASHLHWDLRLEIDGVLKSWAVPKEPPTGKGVKRLAIEVEDHPIEYATFEGEIPKGNYGAGTVAIWDKGELIIYDRQENKIKFELRGKKMLGQYNLIKVPKMGKNSWLLSKVG